MSERADIVIIGGGNAALCAAITAAEGGAKALILEAAPEALRGGNSRHTRNIRCMHPSPSGVLLGRYDEEEYIADLRQVSSGRIDEHLARAVIRASQDCPSWLEDRGVFFQPSLSGALSLSRTNAFFLGGGKALLNALYRHAHDLGVEVRYEAQVRHLEIESGRIIRIDYAKSAEPGGPPTGDIHRIVPESVVVASGGFQADIDWLARAWGPAARNFLIRGTPWNRGMVLADLLEQGVDGIGDPTQCHAVAIDGRAPAFDGGIVTRLDCVPFSIVVNRDAQRFYDEGEDIWPKRYAVWGRLVAAQPQQVGYAIIDSRAIGLFMPSVFPPIRAQSIEELAEKTGLPKERLLSTVGRFNAACPDESNFDPGALDGLRTTGIDPPKSNWARRIDSPPFFAYELRTGVTFTYHGLEVDDRARCSIFGRPMDNLLAAGESMAGSVLGEGYLAGFGMAIGTVFGRIAGRQALGLR
ncbi:FAD-dependent tricarballylate dehydrogenase TcuA [Thioalkalivibrio sp. HK1]|uniref:FAD-dependent tricarballylate dehydrogenase TcuA n=1 Tax=Thioalkalivibrio sp. HK1 TaxID=1469245 RepID=UPI0004709FF7|nr:FAD-dependent tricarballylate dehydrogenase TcuA [Thioalkalivibrio sp. HK1]